MDSARDRARAAGLARTASWTRRTAVGGALLCAALGVVFAHDVPGSAAPVGTSSSTTGGDTGGQLQTPAQPPGSGGGGQSHVTTGGS